VNIAEKTKVGEYLVADDLAGIIALVQMDIVEIHSWNSNIADVEHPDRVIIDLDPGDDVSYADVVAAARRVREKLASLELESWVKTTGGKGLHVVVPLTPEAKWPAVKDFAMRFSVALATAEPDRFTANLAKAARKGRMFLDYLRNQRGATAIMPYSTRARPGAPVAAPISWDELDDYRSGGQFTLRDAETLIERASSRALQGWGEASQVLPDL